jgi:type II secretory pathway pseudopilin PulG
MKILLRLLLKSQHQRNPSVPAKTEKGMTLVELLVGSIMAFLIITPMLAFVVDMLNTDRREQVKSNTEQDIQAAVDFIAQDLSQAIYIYDNNTTTGIPAITKFLKPTETDQIPILVFWKRQILEKSLPVNTTDTPQPINCDPKAKPGDAGDCNDTYVLSLVAYYQFKGQNNTWCQPSGGTCPTRIVRYQIQDGLENKSSDPAKPYTVKPEQKTSLAYNGTFDLTNPEKNVTKVGELWDSEEVLVNYIDHTPGPTLSGTECKTALGKPTDPKDTTKVLEETTLKVSDKATNSFYACVDTARNVARVTIRGNSLRRLETPANYDSKKAAYFPTASVQVQGLGAVGK